MAVAAAALTRLQVTPVAQVYSTQRSLFFST